MRNFSGFLCLLTVPLALSNFACRRSLDANNGQNNKLSSFIINELETSNGLQEWKDVAIEFRRLDAQAELISKSIKRDSFKSQKFEDIALKVPYGTYHILLSYHDQTGQTIYESCATDSKKEHEIKKASYEATIQICKFSSDDAVGSVQSKDLSDIVVRPVVAGSGSTSTDPNQDTGNKDFIDQCLRRDYGLSLAPIQFSKTSYPKSTDSLNLPSLSVNASTKEIKAFIAKVYDQIPLFKSIYEQDLGLTRSQALAFMYADISRESGKDGYWQIALETGLGKDEKGRDNSAHAWGPFQAAVTNFFGAGYDDEVLVATGLPVPNISLFKDPATSTYAGMKRLAEGILKAAVDFGSGKEAKTYLLGTLAHHNTGHTNAALEAQWISFYGAETLRLMQGYLAKSNLINDRAFWTTEPTESICK